MSLELVQNVMIRPHTSWQQLGRVIWNECLTRVTLPLLMFSGSNSLRMGSEASVFASLITSCESDKRASWLKKPWWREWIIVSITLNDMGSWLSIYMSIYLDGSAIILRCSPMSNHFQLSLSLKANLRSSHREISQVLSYRINTQYVAG